MEVNRSQWKSMEVNGSQWKSFKMKMENLQKLVEVGAYININDFTMNATVV